PAGRRSRVANPAYRVVRRDAANRLADAERSQAFDDREGIKSMSKASRRDRLEQALARIADPKGEGARACLMVYANAARKAADAADARKARGATIGPLD